MLYCSYILLAHDVPPTAISAGKFFTMVKSVTLPLTLGTELAVVANMLVNVLGKNVGNLSGTRLVKAQDYMNKRSFNNATICGTAMAPVDSVFALPASPRQANQVTSMMDKGAMLQTIGLRYLREKLASTNQFESSFASKTALLLRYAHRTHLQQLIEVGTLLFPAIFETPEGAVIARRMRLAMRDHSTVLDPGLFPFSGFAKTPGHEYTQTKHLGAPGAAVFKYVNKKGTRWEDFADVEYIAEESQVHDLLVLMDGLRPTVSRFGASGARPSGVIAAFNQEAADEGQNTTAAP
eukprot:1668837-Pyramimonas_sp.AAC.1